MRPCATTRRPSPSCGKSHRNSCLDLLLAAAGTCPVSYLSRRLKTLTAEGPDALCVWPALKGSILADALKLSIRQDEAETPAPRLVNDPGSKTVTLDGDRLPWEDEQDWDDQGPMVRRLLRYMYGHDRAKLADLCPVVWEKDSRRRERFRLHSVIHKANTFPWATQRRPWKGQKRACPPLGVVSPRRSPLARRLLAPRRVSGSDRPS